MGRTCGACGGQVFTRFWWRDLGERYRSEDIGIDNINMHLQETDEDSVDCIDLPDDREKWRDIINVVMNIRVP
jgi:hypothetical protein